MSASSVLPLLRTLVSMIKRGEGPVPRQNSVWRLIVSNGVSSFENLSPTSRHRASVLGSPLHQVIAATTRLPGRRAGWCSSGTSVGRCIAVRIFLRCPRS